MSDLGKVIIVKRSGGIPKQGIIFICAISIGILLFFAGITPAASQADLDKLSATRACEGCDFNRINLSGRDLAGVNLSKAHLGAANLRGANLSGANLSGAQLGDAVLSDANLTNVDLRGANLAGAYMFETNLSGATWTDGTICKAGSIGRCEK